MTFMSTSSLKSARIVLSLALLVVLSGYWAWLWQRSAPATVGDAPVAQLPCVSYAPFRRPGHGPREDSAGVSRAQVLEDLRILQRITSCVRTYGVDLGLEHVPEVARELGLRVLLGAWLDRDPQATARQVSTALALAHAHRDVVIALVIGNEVLLRGDMQPAELARWLAHVRERTNLPVTYADVWEFWLRHAEDLRAQVDVVTVHILPYWEDHPVGEAQAVTHVQQVALRVQQSLAPRPVFIGEVGWPAVGRQRASAVPSASAQGAMARGLLAAHALHPLPGPGGSWPAFNWIEGFDQPWKRALEGAMGGYWGVFDAHGHQRVTLQGRIPREPWQAAWMGFTLIAALGGAAAGLSRVGCLQAGVLAGAVVLQWHWLQAWCRTPFEWASWGVFNGLCLAAALLVIRRRLRAAMLLQTLAMAASLWLVVQIVLDGRYRALWWPLPWACAWVCAWVRLAPVVSAARPGPLPIALAATGLATASTVVWREGLANAEAWALLSLQALWLFGVAGGPLGGAHDAGQSVADAENAASSVPVSS